MQSEHVSDPAEPGLRSARRGGSTLFQKGGPDRLCRRRDHEIALDAPHHEMVEQDDGEHRLGHRPDP